MEQQENVNLKVTGKSGGGEGGLKDHKDFKSDREREGSRISYRRG